MVPSARPIVQRLLLGTGTVCRGSRAGVLGISGSGAGVVGTSESGTGGSFDSNEGPGTFAHSGRGVAVRAISEANRAASFESRSNVAQIHLVPLEQRTRRRELPREGLVGDLLVIRNVVVDGSFVSDTCSLWLCVPSAQSVVTGVASWQEVKLGDVVVGTI